MDTAILERLLNSGYFPRELPPTFSSDGLGTAISADISAVPKAFFAGTRRTDANRHTVARSGLLRRELGIPNPVSYAAVCFEIASQWPAIEATIKAARLSRSRPVFHARGARAFFPHIAQQGRLVRYRARVRARGRVIVRTDIARFYHSIYTHSVPWALHGKMTAKKQHGMNLPGNRLDRALRNSRDGQTVGVAIGPDASLVVAELVLAKVDEQLQQRMSLQDGFRYVDDYELSADSHDHAADLISALQELLSQYELELNPAKTAIRDLPLPLEYTWASELRSLPLRTGTRGERGDMIRLFDRAFDHVRQAPNEPVLRYLMGRLKHVKVDARNWPIYQQLLVQSAVVEPGCVPSAVSQIIDHVNAGYRLDVDLIQGFVNRFITHHVSIGHENEVAWALWTAITLGLRLTASTVNTLPTSDDSVVILQALHAEQSGLCDRPLEKGAWESLMVPEALDDKNWLVAYEAPELGWLPPLGGSDFIGADPDFSFLRQIGMRFYNVAGVRGVQPTGVAPSFGLAPLFSF